MAGKATANKSCHEEQEQRQSHDADSADGGPDVALKAVLRIQRGRHALPNVRDRLDFVDLRLVTRQNNLADIPARRRECQKPVQSWVTTQNAASPQLFELLITSSYGHVRKRE